MTDLDALATTLLWAVPTAALATILSQALIDAILNRDDKERTP